MHKAQKRCLHTLLPPGLWPGHLLDGPPTGRRRISTSENKWAPCDNHRGLHRGSPGNMYLCVFFCIFLLFLFFIISKVFGLKTVFFELLHAKPCRTIMVLPQTISFGSETCKIKPKLFLTYFYENKQFLASRQRFLIVLTCS